MKFTQRLHARCACAGAAAPFTLAGTERQYERSRPFAIAHLRLDVVLDFPHASLDGVATLSYERKDAGAAELALDAVGMTLGEVAIGEDGAFTPAAYEYDGDQIRIAVP